KGYHHLSNIPQLSSKPAYADSDVEINSDSSFWSDEEEQEQMEQGNRRNVVPYRRQVSRYLSTVNRSLLDRPSDHVADFYISQLNHSVQGSDRHVESIVHDMAETEHVRNR
ncbi:unnamed protein product, partial [Didymodactylos carnosus]